MGLLHSKKATIVPFKAIQFLNGTDMHLIRAKQDAPPSVGPRYLDLRKQLAAWIANVLLIGGVVLVSAHPFAATDAPVFFLFLAGHLCLTLHAVRSRDLPMFVLNSLLALLDLYAIAIRI